MYHIVATTPTACGIETLRILQSNYDDLHRSLQQHLPLAVLKLQNTANWQGRYACVATTPTACGIETSTNVIVCGVKLTSCNNIYRLRYAPKGARQQRSKATMRSAHLKYLNEEKVKQR